MTSSLVFYRTKPWKEVHTKRREFASKSTLKGKKLVPLGPNSFLLEWIPIQKGSKTNFDSYLVFSPYSFQAYI